MRAGFLWLACLAIALSALAGCDDSDSEQSARRSSPADVAPRDALVYAESIIRLRGEAGRPARRFAAALTGLSNISEEALIEGVADLVNEDVDFDLLAPWLGTRGSLPDRPRLGVFHRGRRLRGHGHAQGHAVRPRDPR